MNLSRSATLSLCILASMFAKVDAGLIYYTGFETQANGSVLLGQDGWSPAIPPFLNPNAATITNTVARSGSQSLQVRGVDLVSSGGITAPYEAVGSYRRPVTYDAAANGYPIVRLSTDVRLDGGQFINGDFAAASLAARTAIEAVGEIELSSDGVVYAYDGLGGGPALFTSGPLDLQQWHNLAIEVDFLNDRYSFFVNGTFLGQNAFRPTNTSDVLLRGSLVTYARPDSGAFIGDNFNYRFDNFTVSAVPEPSSILLVCVGGLAIAGRWYRRKTAKTSNANKNNATLADANR